MLSTSSVQFAIDSTNLLMDMSNDDTEIVRLQSLQTLYHMATYDRLTMQVKHMQMVCYGYRGLLVLTYYHIKSSKCSRVKSSCKFPVLFL